MSLYHQAAGQAEIIRTVQKDLAISEQLSQNLSELLRVTGNRNFITYNKFCKLFSQLAYHGFTTLNNLQTLGEEYTGIIQVDHRYNSIPSKLIHFITILLEFGGEDILRNLIKVFETNLLRNDDITDEARTSLIKCLHLVEGVIPFIKAVHRTIFYIYGGKYQISKRVTGINYILVRHWLKENQSIGGYKTLGIFSIFQLVFISLQYIRSKYKSRSKSKRDTNVVRNHLVNDKITIERKCVLCLDNINYVTITRCGHLFCWDCIFDWLNQKSECPICREKLKRSTSVCLQNYS